MRGHVWEAMVAQICGFIDNVIVPVDELIFQIFITLYCPNVVIVGHQDWSNVHRVWGGDPQVIPDTEQP